VGVFVFGFALGGCAQHESGDVVRGSEPGAPAKSRMKRKALQTKILAAIVWLVIVVVVKYILNPCR